MAGAGVRTKSIHSSESNRSPFHTPPCKVQQPESREIAGVGIDLAAEDEVPETIDAQERVAHADAIE